MIHHSNNENNTTMEKNIIDELFSDILNEFKNSSGNFTFTLNDSLRKICNAPDNSCGVYIYTMEQEHKEVPIYIGCSGEIINGEPHPRYGGLKRRIYGKQEGIQRDIFYKEVMKKRGIGQLKVYWYDTGNKDPEFIEYQLILKFILHYHELPAYNKKLEKKSIYIP